jgi:hypothetical protein
LHHGAAGKLEVPGREGGLLHLQGIAFGMGGGDQHGSGGQGGEQRTAAD